MLRSIDQEEEEFLNQYSISHFSRPSVAADIVVFRVTEEEMPDRRRKRPKKLQVLLIKRANHPFKGCWTLPGGFCRPEERLEDTASRELYEETNVSGAKLRLIGVYSRPGRDPRGWIISNTYMALIRDEACQLRTDAEAWEAGWFSREEWEGLSLGFDHGEILYQAFALLQSYARAYHEDLFELLPDTFTLAELQQVFEEILEIPLTKQNFRRKMMEYVEERGEVERGYSHRGAMKFRKRTETGKFL